MNGFLFGRLFPSSAPAFLLVITSSQKELRSSRGASLPLTINNNLLL